MKNIKRTLGLIFFIWLVFLLNVYLNLGLNRFGIMPQTKQGLIGILFSPFLHANYFHIISNSIPLMVLTYLTLVFYKRIAFGVIFFSIVISGILVWLFARSAIHIGASSLIYALASFLFFMGIFSRQLIPILLSIIVAFMYGGLIWGIFPTQTHVSWEGHLFGAIAGLFLAYTFRNSGTK